VPCHVWCGRRLWDAAITAVLEAAGVWDARAGVQGLQIAEATSLRRFGFGLRFRS